MRNLKSVVIAIGLIAAPAMAQEGAAQDAAAPAAAAAAVKKGAMIYTADGRRIGRVDHVREGLAGIIYNGRYVNIPVTSLSGTDGGFKTTLTRAEVNRL